jgi:hypothetical protein
LEPAVITRPSGKSRATPLIAMQEEDDPECRSKIYQQVLDAIAMHALLFEAYLI